MPLRIARICGSVIYGTTSVGVSAARGTARVGQGARARAERNRRLPPERWREHGKTTRGERRAYIPRLARPKQPTSCAPLTHRLLPEPHNVSHRAAPAVLHHNLRQSGGRGEEEGGGASVGGARAGGKKRAAEGASDRRAAKAVSRSRLLFLFVLCLACVCVCQEGENAGRGAGSGRSGRRSAR